MKRFNFSYVGTSKIIFQFFHPFKFLVFSDCKTDGYKQYDLNKYGYDLDLTTQVYYYDYYYGYGFRFRFLGFGFGIARVDALEYVDPDLDDIYRSWIILK
jgi:hypothetical protein